MTVEVYDCKLFWKCCDSGEGCCLDTLWVGITGSMLFIVVAVVMVCLYNWCKKKLQIYRWIRPNPAASGTTSSAPGPIATGPGAPAQTPILSSSSGRLRFLAHFIKLPSYTSISPNPTPQPGAACNLAVREDKPPPYTAVTSDSMQPKTLCEPSTTTASNS
ncbi:hypothetical protein ACOMHN_027018 [Nucella lapillus]